MDEIINIKRILEVNSVKALWRAAILRDSETFELCKNRVISDYFELLNEKNYFESYRMKKSLEAVGVIIDNSEEDFLSEYIKAETPGFSVEKDQLPVTIEDCINATVTVWVDKGLKVTNGAGYADIIIGSGFFIDKRGYLITNYHVIQDLVDPKYEGFSRAYIKLPSDMETKIPAKVIGYDSIIDLALLKVEIVPEFVFELGSSSDLSIGDKISAIGTPIGLEGTITSGIISSTDRKLNTLGKVFQIDAAVNSGNSGGPLIDEQKRVQAVVFAGMLQFQGLNFAIPVEYLKQELPYLYKGDEINHTWIGAYGHTKKQKGTKQGLEVQYVMPGGSASFSGLREGDIITEIDGSEIKSLEDFQFILFNYDKDTIVKCTYKNTDDEVNTIPLLLEKRSKYPVADIYKSDLLEDSFIPIFGMKLIHSSTINRKSYTIEKVLNGTTADEMGFSENDPITIQDIGLDYDNNYIIAQVHVQRRKKGFIDATMTIGSYLDSPYYF